MSKRVKWSLYIAAVLSSGVLGFGFGCLGGISGLGLWTLSAILQEELLG